MLSVQSEYVECIEIVSVSNIQSECVECTKCVGIYAKY